MEGFNLKGKNLRLSINLYTPDNNKLDYLSLVGRFYRLKNMLEKRELIIKNWKDSIANILLSDIENIKKELLIRRAQLKDVELKLDSKEVYKISVDVLTQKNGSKFYRGRINIPKKDRVLFNLKTPRKEFLINRNELKTLVARMNHFNEKIPLTIIKRPSKLVNGKSVNDTKLGNEIQYLIYEKYINFLKKKIDG